MEARLFHKVASVVRLKKKNLKPSDKIPHNCNRLPFKLDGWMKLTIAFGDEEISTQVYVKAGCCRAGVAFRKGV